MMVRLAGIVLMCAAVSWAYAQPRQGVVAQLDVRGDLNSRAMADEIVSWFSRRDPAREVLAVVVVDCTRARGDLVFRVARAIRDCPVPVSVYLDRGDSIAPGVLLWMLSADRAAVGRGVGLAGDQGWALPGLCVALGQGWRGPYEQLCTDLLESRPDLSLLLDVLSRPIGDVWVELDEAGAKLVRQSNDAGAVRVVTRLDEEHWTVDLNERMLIVLGLADQADGIGQVLRQGGVRAFKRERTEVRSELDAAHAEAGRVRNAARVLIEKIERKLARAPRASGHEKQELIESIRAERRRAGEALQRLVGIMDRYPELKCLEPAWGAWVQDDPEAHSKRWEREVSELGERLDKIDVELEAIDE